MVISMEREVKNFGELIQHEQTLEGEKIKIAELVGSTFIVRAQRLFEDRFYAKAPGEMVLQIQIEHEGKLLVVNTKGTALKDAMSKVKDALPVRVTLNQHEKKRYYYFT